MRLIRTAVKHWLRPGLWRANRTGYLARSHYAQLLAGILKKFNVQIAVDVGANAGRYRSFLRDEVNYKGWIVSYEPIPYLVENLQKLARGDKYWLIRGYALGSTETTRHINIMEHDVFTSFLNPDQSKVNDFSLQNRRRTTALVDLCRLDQEWQRISDKLPDGQLFLKTDTQGFDLEVLIGAGSLLESRIAAVQIEASLLAIYEYIPSFVTIYEYLKERNYAIAGMLPVTLDKKSRLVEFDCLFINERI
jgi:FkbM family methyltransferase